VSEDVAGQYEQRCRELQRQLRESESRLAMLFEENEALRLRAESVTRRVARRLRPAAGRLMHAAKRGVRRALR
jgi:regulator of replication initiation timing